MNPTLHHRCSIRLKGYDYSSQGAYFVTLCAQNREHFFGHIDDGTLYLNDAGQMVERWYDEVGRKFPVVECGEMVVMPNHFHCIRHITKQDIDTNIPTVMQWFKTMTTNEYIRGVKELGWMPFDKRLWQRNYFERIIRNEQAYENIRTYIQTNPERWESDLLRRKRALPVRADLRVCPYDHEIGKVGIETDDIREDHGGGRYRGGRYRGGRYRGGHIGPPQRDAPTRRPNGPSKRSESAVRVRADLRVCPYDHDKRADT